MVPAEARFLTDMVDGQGGARSGFVVQVHAFGPRWEQWFVDRYYIADSNREGIGGKAPIDPAAYAEGWDVLTERVLRATYRTPLDGRELRIIMTAGDTGGEDGVTERAYDWFRRVPERRDHWRADHPQPSPRRHPERLVGRERRAEVDDQPDRHRHRPAVQAPDEGSAALMTLWAKVKVADADGVLNFYGLQSLAGRGLESGEVCIRRRMRSRGTDGLPGPLHIQLIEADQVPMLDAETYPGLPVGNVIRSGIEFDRRGRRLAYWMLRLPPGVRQAGKRRPVTACCASRRPK